MQFKYNLGNSGLFKLIWMCTKFDSRKKKEKKKEHRDYLYDVLIKHVFNEYILIIYTLLQARYYV